jgi:putative peptide zinc metalloprotease protein
MVYALIPEDEIDKVKPGMEALMWFPVSTGVMLKRRIDHVRPYNERNLKDSPFSSRLGGEVATEKMDEERKDVPLDPRYVCAVRIDANDPQIRLGMTGRLAVHAPPKSLAMSWFEDVVKTFNKELFF